MKRNNPAEPANDMEQMKENIAGNCLHLCHEGYWIEAYYLLVAGMAMILTRYCEPQEIDDYVDDLPDLVRTIQADDIDLIDDGCFGHC